MSNEDVSFFAAIVSEDVNEEPAVSSASNEDETSSASIMEEIEAFTNKVEIQDFYSEIRRMCCDYTSCNTHCEVSCQILVDFTTTGKVKAK